MQTLTNAEKLPMAAVEAVDARAVERWLSTSSPGHCGATAAGDEGDCASGDQGNFAFDGRHRSDWHAAVSACMRQCAGCARCSFISVSLRWRDCSWYHTCPERGRETRCFRSGAVGAASKVMTAAAAAAMALLVDRHRAHTPPVNVGLPARAMPPTAPESVAVMQASDRPPPPAISAVIERLADGQLRPRPEVAGGQGIRALTAAVNRAFAAAHGYTYVYARIVGGCGRGISAWCALPATLSLLMERIESADADGSGHGKTHRSADDPADDLADDPAVAAAVDWPSGRPSSRARTRAVHRYRWVLSIDEDVAFTSSISFAAWMQGHGAAGGAAAAPSREAATESCHGICQPHGSADLADSDCAADYRLADGIPCLVLAKEINGWPGVNGGSRYLRNGAHTHRLLREWWAWPMRQPAAQQAQYLHQFPAEQNVLNDAILANETLASCVEVRPNHEMYGAPGLFSRHFTGVNVNKEALFFERWPSDTIGRLAADFLPPNATACAHERRHVSMAADAAGVSTLSVRVEYTRHCLTPGLVTDSLRQALWPLSWALERKNSSRAVRRANVHGRV